MALGFRQRSRVSLKKKSGSIPKDTLLRDREWLINAIAVAETGDMNILLDKPMIARIAQEYANGGIIYLKDAIFGGLPGDAYKRMESELREIMDQIGSEGQSKVTWQEGELDPIASAERRLRICISSELSTLSKDWVKDRIPGDLLKKWKQRMSSSRSDLFAKEKGGPIDYSHLGELKDTVIWERNWKEVFQQIFRNQKVFEGKMIQLIEIRDESRHTRDLNELEKKTLETIVRWIDAMIDKYDGQRGTRRTR